ncbi:MAG: MerR family transcriptional regulator [Lachnospiraceae bacterium]|nr:MerR family transcriptional regulator [Lachnospiraceae bacterium]
MTIKEMEERSGIPRANIRYYEAEGLLKPARTSNRYRDYSESDLETLLKIKLLRCLHITLEDIKGLQEGNAELSGILNKNLQNLTTEQVELQRSKEICTAMRNEGAEYSTLKPQRYLDYIYQSIQEESSDLQETVWEADIIPKENMPWRRFFARSLDMSIYSLLWNLFLICVCNVNIQKNHVELEIAGSVMVLVLMLLIEPVLLALFGTTPGKWVLGLSVLSLEGEKPAYQEALCRTVQVIYYGLGISIPIVNFVCLYKNYGKCAMSDDMEWEYRTNIVYTERGYRDIIEYLFSYILIFVVLTLATILARLPQNRGDISAAEFCENVNQLAEYFQVLENRELLEDGSWKEKEKLTSAIVIHSTENWESPTFSFTEKNGVLTGVSFAESFCIPANREGQASALGMLDFYQEEMMLAVLAFLPAREEYPLLSDRAYEIADYISKHAYEDFVIEEYGVKISYELEYKNLENMRTEGFLIKLDDSVDAECSFVFSIEVQ